jgi:hypothetical protein
VKQRSRALLWLGGAPCAGKSSVARLLGDQFSIDVHHVDDSFDACTSQVDEFRHPALSAWMASDWNRRWMLPPEVLLRQVVSCYREHLGFVLEQLRARAASGGLTLVEGSAILPAEIAPWLTGETDAIWLVPTTEFQAQRFGLRAWVAGILQECSDPAGAFERWMARDALFARWLAREVQEWGLACIEVDGSQDVDEVAGAVAVHFGLGRR